MLLPQSQRQLIDIFVRVYRYSLQYVCQVNVWIYSLELTCTDQALDNADVLCAKLRPAEHPVVASHRNGSEGPFQMIRIQGHIWVFKKHPEFDGSSVQVSQRFGEGCGW